MPLEEILNYARMLKRRLWLIILLTLATVGTIVFQQYTAPPRYQASVRFQITDPPRGEVNLFESFRSSAVREEIPFIRENFYNVLTSASVARQVIEKLNLQNTDVDDIASNIETEEIAGSDFTRIKVYAPGPQLAADIANALMEETLRQYGQLRARSATMSRKFIAAELETTRQELRQAQDALIAFKIENRVGSLDNMIFEQQGLLRTLRSWRDEGWADGKQDKAGKLDQAIAQREAELQDLVRISAEYDTLQADVQQARETYTFLRGKETEAKLIENEALTVGFIQVLGQASPPSKPVSPYDLKVVALGAVVSLAVGIVLALVWEFIALTKTSRERREEPVAPSIAEV